MFLGYMISPKGIKLWPDKTEVVLRLSSPRTIKEKCIKNSDFHWTPEAKHDIKHLKQHLSELPMLVAPKPKEELIVYLYASPRAISAVLMTKKVTVQTLVYFISRALQGPELNYTPMEKLVLALVFIAKRLRRYFQAHPIASVMLGEHNITYRPRTSMKGQILADFLVEKPDEASPDTSVINTLFQFIASNNEAEYEALIAGLRIAAQIGVRNVHVRVDSKFVANQVLGTYLTKEENMIKYLEKAKSLGIDIAGPFPEGPGKVKFFIVAMDYFTKWIEAKAMVTITGTQELGRRNNVPPVRGIQKLDRKAPSCPLVPSCDDKVKQRLPLSP
nr:hypothetical protein [Tanacetum cinerariifolium]